MKKPVSILLTGLLVVTSVCGVSAATVKYNTQQATASTSATAPAPQQSKKHVAPKPTIPNIMGVWKNEDFPDLGSIQIVNQSGNTFDIIITTNNSNFSHIATAKATVTLDEVYPGSITVSGSGSFKYTDSFGNSGTGRISVTESVISLDLTETYNSGRGWGISNASGSYLPPYSE